MSFGAKIDKVYYSGYKSETLDIPVHSMFFVYFLFMKVVILLYLLKSMNPIMLHIRMIKNEKNVKKYICWGVSITEEQTYPGIYKMWWSKTNTKIVLCCKFIAYSCFYCTFLYF